MSNKEVAKLIREISKWSGWSIREGSKGWIVYPADKAHKPIMVHKTPSGSRYMANKRAELRRAGAPE